MPESYKWQSKNPIINITKHNCGEIPPTIAAMSPLLTFALPQVSFSLKLHHLIINSPQNQISYLSTLSSSACEVLSRNLQNNSYLFHFYCISGGNSASK